jgi:hypothetical protein
MTFKGLPDLPAIAELKTRAQWVSWRYLERDGKLTKPPVNPHNGYGASHSDPSTWGTYDQAAKWTIEHNLPGVGYVISPDDDLTGVDLDDCRDPDFGGIEAWANEIVSFAESYVEVSPSGCGLRMIYKGKIDKTIKCDPMHVEIYRQQRYLTLTGWHVGNTPVEIRPAPRTEAALRARVESFRPVAATPEPEIEPSRRGAIKLAFSSTSKNFFQSVNSAAMANLAQWVPDLFGHMAHFQPSTGAWRVPSRSLGRNLEEDLSIAPAGIVDFGQADMGDPRLGKRTPIDVVLEFGNAATATDAAFWLCGELGINPETIGWNAAPAETAVGIPATADDDPESLPIAVGSLTGEPKPREWVVPDWIPAGTVTSLSGDGGMGKTLLAQQLIYAVGIGAKWLGTAVPRLRGMGVFCEDDEDELRRRHVAIKTDLGHAIGNEFKETWIWPRVGFDNLLVTFDRNGAPLISAFFTKIMKEAVEKKIELLVLDTIADLFGGNEIIRAQVNYFIKTVCGRLIKEAKTGGWVMTVLLLSHPSQAGRNSGTGESGSTAWNNAVRARLYLTRPEEGLPEQRTLTRKKSNYSASGDDVTLDLVWREGVLRLTGSDKLAAVASCERAIKEAITAAREAGWSYKSRQGGGKPELHKAMLDLLGARFKNDGDVISQALKNLGDRGAIQCVKTGDLRGYLVLEK